MPIDAVTVSALTYELSRAAAGSKIEKIRQPEKDIIILSLRGGAGGKLLISCEPGNARIHLTGKDFENPNNPPAFCMLLRKHIRGAIIKSVYQPDAERIIILELDVTEESGARGAKSLITEMTGRSSNIVLAGSDGRIIDCLRKISPVSGNRHVLPGMLYRLPDPINKPFFFGLGKEETVSTLTGAGGDAKADKRLFDAFTGLSPLICRELCYRAFGETSPPFHAADWEAAEKLAEEAEKLRDLAASREFTPYLLSDKNKPADFSYTRILQYEGALACAEFPDFSSLLDAFYTERDKTERLRRKARELMKPVKSAAERTRRKLENQKLELVKASERDVLRKHGELITANIYRLKKGDAAFSAEDTSADGVREIEIRLDPLKSPAENAAKYFREYKKAKTAEKYLNELILKNSAELEYLESVEEELERAGGEADLADIDAELIRAGFRKAGKPVKPGKPAGRGPIVFKSDSGFEIYVGRNNIQNDIITKNAKKTDIWLHAQKIPGSHVIISCNGVSPDQLTIEKAAVLAAYHSSGRGSGITAVDYTQVRFVRKPAGSRPGKAIYSEFKTIFVRPEEAEIMLSPPRVSKLRCP